MKRRLLIGVLAFLGLCFSAMNVIAADKPESCSLLSKADIEAALGMKVGDGKPVTKANPAGGIPCQYLVGSSGVFSILIKSTAPGETPARVMEEMKKMKIAVAETKGVGDSSFYSSPGYGMVQLNTFKGKYYLIITMMLSGKPEAAQKTAAETLIDRKSVV
jgi:hypothetical protein